MVKINRRFFLQGVGATAALGIVDDVYDVRKVLQTVLPAEGFEIKNPERLIKNVCTGLKDAVFQISDETATIINALRQDPQNIFSKKEAPEFLEVILRRDEPAEVDFKSFYRSFCERSALIKLFDLLCPEDGDMFTLDERKHIASRAWYLNSCIAGPLEGEVEFETAKYLRLIDNLQNKAWREKTYQALRKDYVRLAHNAVDATEAMPHFGITLFRMHFATYKEYIGLNDPEFAREIHFFKEYGFWSGHYTQGPNLDILTQLQNSYLGRYCEYVYSQKQAMGITAQLSSKCEDFDSLHKRTEALQIFEDEVPFAEAMRMNDASEVIKFLRQIPKYSFKKLTVDFNVTPQNIDEESSLEPRVHASHYMVDLKFNKKDDLNSLLGKIFSQVKDGKDYSEYRVTVPIVAADDVLDCLQSWRNNPMIMRRAFSAIPK